MLKDRKVQRAHHSSDCMLKARFLVACYVGVYLALILELVWRYIPYMPIETIHSRSCGISEARWLYAVVAAYLDMYQ